LSFSSNVKSELLRCFGEEIHCLTSEISAILNLCGQISENDKNFCVKIQTENVVVARKFFTLIKKKFNIECSITVRRNRQFKKSRIYIITLEDSASRRYVEDILKECAVIDGDNKEFCLERVKETLINDVCCKKAYIRGAFLSCGSVNDPEKTYHMEFVVNDEKYCSELLDVINYFGIEAKSILRKEHYVIYIKEGEHISDLLNIMGAHVALMEFENIRILKDMRNNVNRKVNCETANLNKTINAAVKQIEEIEFIRDNYGLKYLPPNLEAAAQARLDYPDASLKELGAKMMPPVGKSGINHRLQKISEIADELMRGKEPKND